MGWIAFAVVAALAAALFGAWRYAHATNSVALLDLADRVLAGSAGSRVAVKDARFGADPENRETMVAETRLGPCIKCS